jgi:hypothetical protein
VTGIVFRVSTKLRMIHRRKMDGGGEGGRGRRERKVEMRW